MLAILDGCGFKGRRGQKMLSILSGCGFKGHRGQKLFLGFIGGQKMLEIGNRGLEIVPSITRVRKHVSS